MVSWIWKFYTKITKNQYCCNICSEIIFRKRGLKYFHYHLTNVHEITKQDNLPNERARIIVTSNIERPKLQKDNCHVCNDKLTSCRNKLTAKMILTSTPIFEILEKFTGAILDCNIRNNACLCHQCLFALQQYDKWQYKSAELHRTMAQMMKTTNTEQSIIKQELESDPGEDYSDEAINESRDFHNCSHEESPPYSLRVVTRFQNISQGVSRVVKYNDETRSKIIKLDDYSEEDRHIFPSMENRILDHHYAKRPRLSPHPFDVSPPIDKVYVCVKCSERFTNPHYLQFHLALFHHQQISSHER